MHALPTELIQRAHSTPEPDIPPAPEGDPHTPPPEKMPQTDPVPIEEPTPPQPPVKMREINVCAI